MEGGEMPPKAAAGLLIVRPLLLKAGIPLFLSVTGFVCTRIIIALKRRSTSRTDCGTASSMTASQGNTTKAREMDPSDDEIHGDIVDDGLISFGRDLLIEDSQSLVKLQLIALSSVITDLRERESTLESRFLRYYELKERESELLEIGYVLQLRRARLELLRREIARMEGDCKLLEEFSEECRKALEEVGYRWRVEKLWLRSKLRKMKRRVETGGKKMREGRLKIEEKERELAETRKENDELREKLAAAEKSVATEKLAEAEETELVYLRWSNACLKHELTKNTGQEKQEDAASSANEEEEAGAGDGCVPCPPKKGQPPKIMKKLKRWGRWVGGDDSKVKVNPSEDVDEKRHDMGFFLRHHPV